MDVITKYPIVKTTSAKQTKAKFRRTYDAADGIAEGLFGGNGSMNVETEYPIVYTNSDKQSEEEYRATYSGVEGGSPMVVTTDYPIVYTKSDKESEDEYRGTYSAVLGDLIGSRSERAARKTVRKAKRASQKAKGEGFFQRAGKGIKKFIQSDAAKAVAGAALGGGAVAAGESMYGTDPSLMETPKKGLSTGAKVAIGVVAVGVIGAIIYFSSQKSK